MFGFVGAFLAQLAHDVVAFVRLPAVLALLLRSPHATSPPTSAIMPRAKGSKALDLAGDIQRREMVHIKTKEECRLANETVDVWSIELPSKHAEAILKCVTTICHLPSAIHRRPIVRRLPRAVVLHWRIAHCAVLCDTAISWHLIVLRSLGLIILDRGFAITCRLPPACCPSLLAFCLLRS